MMPRHQPPVHSPLSLGAVLAGVPGLLTDETATRPAVLVKARYEPLDVLLTASGTAALTLAIREALRDRGSNLVALPAYCCYDLATAAIGANARVALYDTDPSTLSPDLDSLAHALALGAGAVVVAHLYGIPVDLDSVVALARRTGAIVVNDAAQAAGAQTRGGFAASGGSLAVLSFGRGKGLTGGGGGALLANDELGVRLLGDARRELGAAPTGAAELVGAASQWLLARPIWYGVPAALPFLHLGETRYRRPVEPRRMPAAAAAIMCATWSRALDEEGVRRHNAERLLGRLRDGTATPIRWAPDASPAFLRLPIMLPERDAALRGTKRLGICPGYPRALADLPQLDSRLVGAVDPAGARRLVAELATLPTHGLLREPDLRRLERWIESIA